MDVWFCIEQEQSPRGKNRERKNSKSFHAPLLSAWGLYFSLDEDLSWKSRWGSADSSAFLDRDGHFSVFATDQPCRSNSRFLVIGFAK